MDSQRRVENIISRCKKGNGEAFSELIDMYASRCYGYLYRLTGDSTTSNDLLSEVFVRLVEKISSYKGGSFEKWLFTIATNIFHDHLRQQYRQRRLLDAKVRELEAVRPQARAEQELLDTVQIQLRKLDDDTAELLMMRFYSGLSFKELAEIRKEPIGTTLCKVHRGLKKLRELMGDTGD